MQHTKEFKFYSVAIREPLKTAKESNLIGVEL